MNEIKDLPRNNITFAQLQMIIDKKLQEDLCRYLNQTCNTRDSVSFWRSCKRYFRQIDDGQKAPSKTIRPDLVAAIEKFTYQNADDLGVYQTLRDRLANSDGFEGWQDNLNNYLGSYDVYQATSDRMYLQENLLEIIREDKKDGSYYRWLNRLPAPDMSVKHHGFAFDYKDRIYLTGMGPHFTRPMLINKPGKFNKRSMSLSAIVMGQTKADHLYSATCVLIHENHSRCAEFKENSGLVRELMIKANCNGDLIKLVKFSDT